MHFEIISAMKKLPISPLGYPVSYIAPYDQYDMSLHLFERGPGAVIVGLIYNDQNELYLSPNHGATLTFISKSFKTLP